MKRGQVDCTLAALAVLGIAGCSAHPVPDHVAKGPNTASSALPTPPQSAQPTCPPTPLSVTLTYSLVKNANGEITVNAETNLPEDTSLQASFYVSGGAFIAQDTKQVVHGSATFGPFSDHGSPLHGAYDFSITAPIPRNQPRDVHQCLGAAGEKMTGPLVKRDDITGDNYAAVEAPILVN